MTRPRILDLFCGAGGCSVGYARAGFDVVGVDMYPQPNYPYEFHQGDALDALQLGMRHGWLYKFTAIHASPPCQAFTTAQRIQKRTHDDLIEPTRRLLEQTGLPYVIENVPGAPLKDPVQFCGQDWGLLTYRHRLFETNWPLRGWPHQPHRYPQAKMGRRPAKGEFIQVVGNFSDVAYARRAMEIPWMTRDELREAIPPIYTEVIGQQLLKALRREPALRELRSGREGA